ncbi:MBL fold metallo-hydrolase [Methylocystis echinoides]|uniref:ribonuclease Z n=1 Tax=Methylocystis echinoides TaxID=29468 RepID=UPI00341A9B59
MPRHFDPTLVNDRFDDPGLYVDLAFERRALLFDIGDIAGLPTRKILRISDVFVSHRHMDHFAGFDQLLRRVLGREKVIGIYGPAGSIEAIGHKLKAYTWNLLDGYDGNVSFRVTEMDAVGNMTSALFSGRESFSRQHAERRAEADGLLLKEPGIQVRATTLDHGVPVLAFALEERAQINVWRNKLEAAGLAVGPWLRDFKEAVLHGRADAFPIEVSWQAPDADTPKTLPLGQLRNEIMRVSTGRKIAYVVDCAFTRANVEKIVALAKDADTLFIEATFFEADAAIAAQRRHLTAHQAGTIARLAGVKRLVTFHYSPRYRGEGERLAEEAQLAFLGR